MSIKNSEDYIGLGFQWHPSLGDDLLADLEHLGCVEIIAENFFFHGSPVLERIRASKIPTLIHAVEMSLGSADGFRQKHFERILDVAAQVNAVNFSDHVGWSFHHDIETLQPAILPFTQEAALCTARNITVAQAQIGSRPFLIENEANRYVFPFNDMSEAAFFNTILEEADCRMLLDLTNLHTNAVNFGIDPYEFLDELNIDRVHTIHLAGGTPDAQGVLIDSHDASVPDQVWELLRYTTEKICPVATILERNDRFPPYATLKAELAIAQDIIENSKGYLAIKTPAPAMTRPEVRL